MEAGETRVRVRYAETDQMGVVYYANYFVWMELGRTELCRSTGFRYRDMEEQYGILLVVIEASCRYKFPARYDEEVIVRTRLTKTGTRVVTFGYEMISGEHGKLLAEGSSSHMFCGRDMRPARVPEAYYSVFGIKEQPAPGL